MTDKNILPEFQNELRLFIQHLDNYKTTKKIIKIAEKIEFEDILSLFNENFENLWKKIEKSPDNGDTLDSKQEFRDQVLLLLRESIFNVLYLGIKDLNAKGMDYQDLNKGIHQDFDRIMQNLFNAFETEYRLLQPGEKHAARKVKKTVSTGKPERKHQQKKSHKTFKEEDIPYYEMVLKAWEKMKKSDESISLRAAALNIAKSEKGLTNKDELQDFYKRFINYRRK